MAGIVPDGDIEDIVGVTRHPTLHLGRADSRRGMIYILHSAECKAGGDEALLSCEYTRAMENGVDHWPHEFEDRPVVLGVYDEGLYPEPDDD